MIRNDIVVLKLKHDKPIDDSVDDCLMDAYFVYHLCSPSDKNKGRCVYSVTTQEDLNILNKETKNLICPDCFEGIPANELKVLIFMKSYEPI